MGNFRRVVAGIVLFFAASVFGLGQQRSTAFAEPELQSAEALYAKLGSVGLDTARVYNVREASLDRSSLHLSLIDGTIAFTQDIAGRVTGAFFRGEGEVLLMPPDQAERSSMLLFTGAAILEERFATAYFRFNDDTVQELQPYLTPAENAASFVAQWNDAAEHLASGDAFRLFVSFSRFLPNASGQSAGQIPKSDSLFHARVEGLRLGVFDLYYDSTAFEQVWAGQLQTVDQRTYYNIWTSFSVPRRDAQSESLNSINGEIGRTDAIHILDYKIQTVVSPPTQISSEAIMHADVLEGGERTLIFELSRFLRIQKIEVNGQEVPFVHNPSMEGTQLAERGNDAVAVVLPESLKKGQSLQIRFVYEGDVLSQAGGGLLYVGARGTWYPNRGRSYANFNLEFQYPRGWTLIATGKRINLPAGDSKQNPDVAADESTQWVTERPIPLAGFDLGRYKEVTSHAAKISVETYAARGVEDSFPRIVKSAPVLPSLTGNLPSAEPLPITTVLPPPSPARNADAVSSTATRAVEFYSQCFGPFPYSSLKLAQVPGVNSQGWPGLIFLSTYSFLTNPERAQLHMAPMERAMSDLVIAHETAHQWWGDLVGWKSYRDQWLSEALANYSALLLLQSEDAYQYQELLTKYRDDLIASNNGQKAIMDAGPVTFGSRLLSSQFPRAYIPIVYGRGTWLLHMLHGILDDGINSPRSKNGKPEDDPFLRALLRVREKYEQQPMTTHDLLQAFAEELPRQDWYEGEKSLDWFYDSWINGTSVPLLEIDKQKLADKGKATQITGILLQKDAPDDLVTSVPLYAAVGSSGKLVWLGRVFADGPETQFSFTGPARTRKVVLDPFHTVLRREQ